MCLILYLKFQFTFYPRNTTTTTIIIDGTQCGWEKRLSWEWVGGRGTPRPPDHDVIAFRRLERLVLTLSWLCGVTARCGGPTHPQRFNRKSFCSPCSRDSRNETNRNWVANKICSLWKWFSPLPLHFHPPFDFYCVSVKWIHQLNEYLRFKLASGFIATTTTTPSFFGWFSNPRRPATAETIQLNVHNGSFFSKSLSF